MRHGNRLHGEVSNHALGEHEFGDFLVMWEGTDSGAGASRHAQHGKFSPQALDTSSFVVIPLTHFVLGKTKPRRSRERIFLLSHRKISRQNRRQNKTGLSP